MRICSRLAGGMGIAVLALQAAAIPEASHSVKLVVRTDKSGRLVRSVAVAPRAVRENAVAAKVIAPSAPGATAEESGPPPAGAFQEAVERLAQKHNLPPALVHSVIRVESNYNPYAISPKGALGLMQLIPSTARRFGVANAFNPAQNLEGGMAYLRHLLDLYHDNYPLALAAYNAGEAAVQQFGGIPPYPETRNYIQQVFRRLAEAKQAADKPAARPPAAKPETKPAEYNRIRAVVQPDGRLWYVSH